MDERLGPWVATWPEGDEQIVWHRITGRHLRLHRETLARLAELPPVQARLRRLHLLADAPADPSRLIPVRHHTALLLPDAPALWVAVPEVHTHGGHGWRPLPLDGDELRLWRAVNDARTTAEVATRAALPVDRALAFFARLTDPAAQALQLRDASPHPADRSLARLAAPPRAHHPRAADQLDARGATTLAAYHLDAVRDGATHFDDRETTVAHALMDPHPALGGRRYGEALHDALRARGLPTAGHTVEIGCGTGALAAAWLSRGGDPDRYLRIDLSPELLATQAARVATPAVLADATRLPLADRCADLVVSNEVLADLTAAPWSPGDGGEVAEWIARFHLDVHPGRAWYNLGAWQLLEQVARVLRPGGAAYLSEFGALDEAPEEAVQLDHPEVSIHFGHLATIARGLGLEAEIVRLDELLGLDLGARQLSRTSWYAVRALAAARGLHLPARAWTPETLAAALPWPVEGLRWVPLSDEGPGPLVTRFQALLLRRS